MNVLMHIEMVNLTKVGAKLKQFAPVWDRVIGDQWAHNLLNKGLLIDLEREPIKNPQEEFHLNEEDSQLMREELVSMLEKGAIEECPTSDLGIISPLFVIVQKKKKRLVCDGRYVNGHTRKEHFMMESLATVKEVLE
jgi:hypothetical protein